MQVAAVSSIDDDDDSLAELLQRASMADKTMIITFVDEAVAKAGLRLERDAQRHLVDWLGDDPGKLPGVLAVLASTYGEGARLAVADVDPFLGDAGGVPPWDLTDAIDRGNTASALELARRMVHGGDRHPLQILAILQERALSLGALLDRLERDYDLADGTREALAARLDELIEAGLVARP